MPQAKACGYNGPHSKGLCTKVGRAMAATIPSVTGRRFLERRDFLGNLASGLGGIAFLALLKEQQTAAAERTPIRPPIRPEAPLAARPPHFTAKAKRVLHIFCSGACSHLDTWDYKPELIKRD